MKAKRLYKGSGTFLEYTITSVILTLILIIMVSIFIKRFSIENFELYSAQIARDIVTCTSLEEAQELAEEEAETFFSEISTIREDDINVFVEYAPGSPEEWRKGNFIVLYIEGKINPLVAMGTTNYNTRTLVMIEKNEVH